MFKNYLKIAIRNLKRHKGYSFINIFGLATGIACFILIFLYVQNEMTYDTFHKNADQIYKIYSIDESPNGKRCLATSPDPLALTLQNDYPELTNIVSLLGKDLPVSIDGKSFKEKVFITEPAFFNMFSFHLLKGNPKTALGNVNSVVITENLAVKYFGNEDPMGKTLTILGKHDFVITGVLKKIPENSSIQFGMLIPDKIWSIIFSDNNKQWSSISTHTYVQFSEKFTPKELKNQLPFIKEKYFPDFMKNRVELDLLPIKSIHLNSRMIHEIVSPNSAVYLYILLVIAFSVLSIACFNFMNLSTARYTERTNEIGIRKVLGSGKLQLIKQFLGESVLLSFLALILGITLAELFLPKFNALTGKRLDLLFRNNFMILLGLIGFGVFVGIFAGSYPAFFLSKHKPVDVLKGQRTSNKGDITPRRILVISQFAISTLLIICTFIINRQLKYMKNHDLGFDPENVIAIPTHTLDLNDPLPQIKAYVNTINTRKASLGIISVAISENTPGSHFQNKFGIIPENWDPQNSVEMIVTSIDDKFLETYQMKLIEGRNFSQDFGTDQYHAILINETAVKMIGWQKATDKFIKFNFSEAPLKVIGVVKDIHFKSLNNKIEPLVYRFAGDKYKIGFISVRIRSENITEILKFLQEQWQYIVPDIPFEYFFIEDKFADSYKKETKTTEIIGLFSLISIILTSLGLLGLSAMTVTQRTKEIGIRKVLGASIYNIVLLISKQFIKLVLLANIISWPIAYLIMKEWLRDYPYCINLELSYFLLGGLLALLIALLTVSSQAIKAAFTNPVEALRYE